MIMPSKKTSRSRQQANQLGKMWKHIEPKGLLEAKPSVSTGLSKSQGEPIRREKIKRFILSRDVIDIGT
jgi:hypothetical protein